MHAPILVRSGGQKVREILTSRQGPRAGQGSDLEVPKSLLMTPDDILRFWFTELAPDQWFRGGEAVDEMIGSRYEPLIEAVHSGGHDDWSRTPQGRLAMLLVLDQFPRNIYRGQARAFAYDDKALALALEGIAAGADQHLDLHERAFFYLPLEHSESLEIQDRSLERYAALVLSIPPEQREQARNYLDYAWQHYSIIKRFGRYPHRNEILGRESSAEETEFLRQPGSSF